MTRGRYGYFVIFLLLISLIGNVKPVFATDREHFIFSAGIQAVCEGMSYYFDHQIIQGQRQPDRGLLYSSEDTKLRTLSRHLLCFGATIGVNAVYEALKTQSRPEYDRLLPAAEGAGLVFVLTFPF